MKKLMMAALIATTAACGGPAGATKRSDLASADYAPVTRRSYDPGDFTRVSAAGPIHVVVSVGPAISVRAEGSAKTLDLYEVVVEHGALEIGPRNDWYRNRNHSWRDIEPATFTVTLPRLSAAALAGSGDMKVDRVDGDHFSASLAGSGDLDIDALSVDDAKFSVAGSGNLIAQGTARQANVSIAGSGNARTRKVSSDRAAVSIVGSGNVALTVTGTAHVTIMGSGDVDIDGPASCRVSRMGSGHVRCNGRLRDGEES